MLNTESTPYSSLGLCIIFVILKIINKIFKYFPKNFSGLLTTYITLSITKGNLKNFSSFGFLFARFIRLTPQLAIFLLLNFLLPLMASGPVWRELTDTLMDKCYKNWWLNVLYLQNFINVKEMVKFFSD